jgi:ParB-like chromosome segregation protein Spo0J
MSIEELQRAIVIDPEFESLIPPLSADEFKQLEANIRRDGCTDPLTFSNGILVDGHNRYKICQKRGIAFKTETLKDCLTRDHVMVWIDERQLGRRNLDDDKRAMVALTWSSGGRILRAMRRLRQRPMAGQLVAHACVKSA